MSDILILDVLLGVIVALFAAIGVWRGFVKEVVVTAAIFAGAALAGSWAQPWGADLADLVDSRVAVGRMIVTAIALIGATVALGYVGASLIQTADITWWNRIAGGLLAAANGILLIHYLLVAVERFFTGSATRDALADSRVAHVLLREWGWVLIAAAALFLLLIAFGRLRGRDHPAIYVETPIVGSPGGFEPQLDARGRPVKLPRDADEGKYEPLARGYNRATGRYAADSPSHQDTIAIPPVDPERWRRDGGRAAAPAAPVSHDPYNSDAWLRRAGSAQSGDGDGAGQPKPTISYDGDDPYGDRPSSAEANRGGANGWESPFAANGKAAKLYRRCQRCAGIVGEQDEFCPHCGARVSTTPA